MTVTVALASALAGAGAQTSSFKAFLTSFEQGTSRFINGDNVLWKENASHGEDVTLMGGWGTYERGWKDVAERYDWAAKRFHDTGAAVKVEYVAMGESGDLAYTVSIERSVVAVSEQPATTAPMALRVTHLFRRESGSWKLIHRHADPLLNTTSAGSVLKK